MHYLFSCLLLLFYNHSLLVKESNVEKHNLDIKGTLDGRGKANFFINLWPSPLTTIMLSNYVSRNKSVVPIKLLKCQHKMITIADINV